MPSKIICPVLAAFARIVALSPRQQKQLVRRMKDFGILERKRRGEKHLARNNEIRALDAQGWSDGAIALHLGLTRGAVQQVLFRSRHPSYAKAA